MAQRAISGITIHNLAGMPEIAAQFPAYDDQAIVATPYHWLLGQE